MDAPTDGSWRVRENALKIAVRHLVDESHALDATQQLQDDPVPRVRAAARRALIQLRKVTPGELSGPPSTRRLRMGYAASQHGRCPATLVAACPCVPRVKRWASSGITDRPVGVPGCIIGQELGGLRPP